MFAGLEATCTGKYNALVNNGAGGNLDKPCKGELGVQLYCNQGDADAWIITADALFAKVRSTWNFVVGKGATIPPAVRVYITALERDYCEADDKGVCVTYKLPTSSWWNVEQNSRTSLEIARWCSRAACALELLDMVGSGGLPVETPPNPKPSIDLPGMTGWLPWAAGAALLLLFLRR